MSTGSRTIALAERVIRASNRERPADSVLRQQLKTEKQLEPREAAETARAVFAYYRWKGWLEPDAPLGRSIGQALELAERAADEPLSFPDSELLERAVPAWLSKHMEVLPAWLRTLQQEPKLWLRAKPGQGRAVAKSLSNCRVFGEGVWSDTLQYLGRADLFRTADFQEGKFEVQDISSQAVGLACDPKPGEKWWDACAGEGGKTLHLSALMQNQGLVWASDASNWRLERLKRRAARAGVFNFRRALWKGDSHLPTRTTFDGVLVDAPCSGIGTWQRNPHARWTLLPEDVAELSALQSKLLENASAAVKPGGKLVYAVCTMAKAETVEVVRQFSEKCAGFKPLAVQNPLSPAQPATHSWQLWPQEHCGNGMFVAVWSRSA